MLEEQTTPKDRKDGCTTVAFGGGSPGGVDGLESSLLFILSGAVDAMRKSYIRSGCCIWDYGTRSKLGGVFRLLDVLPSSLV
jgi:hypothetical protein